MQTNFQSRNPFSGELEKSFSTLDADQLEFSITKLVKGQKVWRSLSVGKRVAVIEKVAQILLHNVDTYAQLMEKEMGKLVIEGIAEVKKCASLCHFNAGIAKGTLRARIEILEEAEVTVRHQPLGVIFAIMPWNFPFWQLFRAAVPTLLAGNVVLLKHAMNTPQCALAIQEIFDRAFPEASILQSVFINHEQAENLIADKRIHGVTLTGSKKAGMEVAAAAARAVKPCVLELGGSDPFIVFADANLEDAVRTAVASRCINNGQSCIAAKRFIVEKSVFERFSMMMSELMSTKRIGPQANENQLKTLKEQVADALDKGAILHCGGEAPQQKGFYYPPTVLSSINSSMRAAREEVFGPVALLYVFESEEEALQLANESDFGLGATLFTKNQKRIERFSEELECGVVSVNEILRSDPRFPFGGIKESGFGRELGPNAVLAFTNEKTIWVSKST